VLYFLMLSAWVVVLLCCWWLLGIVSSASDVTPVTWSHLAIAAVLCTAAVWVIAFMIR
jgi:hypothetical protein